MSRPVVLIVLDGWGLGPKDESNPIHVVNPQTFAWLEEHYPVTSLQASGISVGLPWGEVGNSEVGHLTLGAGKVVYQYYPRITLSIQNQTFFENTSFKNAFSHARENNSAVNLVGLLSKGNVHASVEHIQALLRMAELEGISNVKLHLWTDGKDCTPRSLAELLQKIPLDKLASLTGRYYSMNRSDNWQLTEKAYNTMLGKDGQVANTLDDVARTIEFTYKKNLSEEFLTPIRFAGKEIAENDSIIFINFREDSMQQIAGAFLDPTFSQFPITHFNNVYVTTMTRYAERFQAITAFPPDVVEHPLGWVLSQQNKTQLRIAETYKHAHVTSFFNGLREEPFPNEYRALIPSQKGVHPEEHPELMATAITDRLLEAIQDQTFDFILANYSNPDTIAHTGNYDAGLEAVRVIDREMNKILRAAAQSNAIILITSDHGNVEVMLNSRTGEAETQHDASPVPFYLIASEFQGRRFPNSGNLSGETIGILSDVAPTILELMGLPQPEDMNGQSLLRNII